MKRVWLQITLLFSVLFLIGCGGDDDSFFFNNPPAGVTALFTIQPNQGPEAGGNTVVLTGVGFEGVSGVRFGETAANFTVVSAERIEAVVPAGTGTVSVRITNNGQDSNPQAYIYLPLPTLTALAPNLGPLAGGNTVVLTGTGLTGASAVNFGGTAVPFRVDSATQISAVAPAGSGDVAVEVVAPGGTSNSLTYTYTFGLVLTSISPDSISTQFPVSVVLTGEGFTGATSVRFGALQALSFTVDSDTQITVFPPITLTPQTVAVAVTTPEGTSNSLNFSYTVPPSLFSALPNVGPESGGTTVTLTGSGFTGASAVSFGGTPATSFTVNSDAEIIAVTPAGTGIAFVTVTTPAGTTIPPLFFNYQATPTILNISPNAGPVAGGTSVTVTGTGFNGATSVTFGGVPTPFTIISDSNIVAIAPASVAGAVDVVVVNGVGSATAAGGYTYVAPPSI